MTSKTITKHFIYNLATKFVLMIVPFLLYSYIASIFGPSLMGELSFAESFIVFFIPISQLGLYRYGIRGCAKRDGLALSSFVYELVFINFCVSLITILFIYLISAFLPSGTMIRILAFELLFYIPDDWLYEGKGQYKYIAVRTFFLKIFHL